MPCLHGSCVRGWKVRFVNDICISAGVVYSVTIYASEYGKERMRDEAVHGPRIWDETGDRDGEEVTEVGGEDRLDQEALRRYQRDRMKYYYAVADCDSIATGSAVYRELDGEEYLNSGVLLDIRFIPDDMDFDEDEPREVATEVPADYEPRQFVAAALQQSTVRLTWYVQGFAYLIFVFGHKDEVGAYELLVRTGTRTTLSGGRHCGGKCLPRICRRWIMRRTSRRPVTRTRTTATTQSRQGPRCVPCVSCASCDV